MSTAAVPVDPFDGLHVRQIQPPAPIPEAERIPEEQEHILNLAEVAGRLDEIPLLPEERARLATLEAVVDEAEDTFLRVAEALEEIHRRKLYRPAAWNTYVEERWKMSRSGAYRMLDWYSVYRDLHGVPALGQMPNTAIAALAPLDYSQRREVAEQALAAGWSTREVHERVQVLQANAAEEERRAKAAAREYQQEHALEENARRPEALTPGVPINRSAECPPEVRISAMEKPWRKLGVDAFNALGHVEAAFRDLGGQAFIHPSWDPADLNDEERDQLLIAVTAAERQLPAIRDALKQARRQLKPGRPLVPVRSKEDRALQRAGDQAVKKQGA